MRLKKAPLAWVLYSALMILMGVLPLVRIFLAFWLRQILDVVPRFSYGIFIGDRCYISTELFWVVYLVVMGAFVIYGIVCMVQAHTKTFGAHTLAQSVSPKTVICAALCGNCIGAALACGMCTIQLLSGPERYPLDDFFGSLGAIVGYLAAVIVLIVYAHARRRPFMKKGLIFEIGVALFGVLAGAMVISVLKVPLEVWEDANGYLNAFVERVQGPAW